MRWLHHYHFPLHFIYFSFHIIFLYFLYQTNPSLFLLPHPYLSFPPAELVWVQEEPKNMGSWSYVKPRFDTILREGEIKRNPIRWEIDTPQILFICNICFNFNILRILFPIFFLLYLLFCIFIFLLLPLLTSPSSIFFAL